MKLVFATNNRHKLDEVRAIVGNRVEVLSLNDIDCHDDIPETADTLQGNALIKARYIYEKYGLDCLGSIAPAAIGFVLHHNDGHTGGGNHTGSIARIISL